MSDKLLYIYVEYEDDKGGKMYCYTSDNHDIKKGDKVLVDRAGEDAIGTVINIKYYTNEEAPYPIEKVKKIHDTWTDDEIISEDELISSFNHNVKVLLKNREEIIGFCCAFSRAVDNDINQASIVIETNDGNIEVMQYEVLAIEIEQ